MVKANALVLRRSLSLWVGTALLIALNTYTVFQPSYALIKVTLALTAVFAFYGVGFGIWAARKMTHRHN